MFSVTDSKVTIPEHESDNISLVTLVKINQIIK